MSKENICELVHKEFPNETNENIATTGLAVLPSILDKETISGNQEAMLVNLSVEDIITAFGNNETSLAECLQAIVEHPTLQMISMAAAGGKTFTTIFLSHVREIQDFVNENNN